MYDGGSILSEVTVLLKLLLLLMLESFVDEGRWLCGLLLCFRVTVFHSYSLDVVPDCMADARLLKISATRVFSVDFGGGGFCKVLICFSYTTNTFTLTYKGGRMAYTVTEVYGLPGTYPATHGPSILVC